MTRSPSAHGCCDAGLVELPLASAGDEPELPKQSRLVEASLHDPAAAGRVHEPGVVVLADDLSLVALTAQASEYLAQMEPVSSLPLPVCIYAAAAALRAIDDGSAAPGSMPTTRVHAHTGLWLT